MSDSVEQGQVAVVTSSTDGILVESKVDEINEKNLSLDALKCAIEAIGDAMAELAETSAVVPKKEDGEEKDNQDKQPEALSYAPLKPVVADLRNVKATDSFEKLVMDQVVEEYKDENTDSKIGEDMSESGFENVLSQAMKSVKREVAGGEAAGTQSQEEQMDTRNIQPDNQRLSIDTLSLSTSLTEYEEIEVEEEIEVDDDDTNSQVNVEGDEKPKKKKKLRILKKIRRAPGKLAYGALFSMGALVGGSIVGSQAIGQGMVDGGKAVGQGAKSGAGFVADTTVKFAEGTKDIAKRGANKVAEGAKAGGDFVVDTGGKIVDGTKETAVNFAKATSGAVTDSANAALYGVGAVVGGTLAVGQGVGHGALVIGHGVVGGTKAIGHGVVDGTKAGAKFITDTTTKAADHIEEKARQTLVSAIEATQAGAQYAGYGKQQGNSLAIEGDKSAKKLHS